MALAPVNPAGGAKDWHRHLLFWHRLPATHLNGIGVGLGVALIQTLCTLLFGLDAGLAAVVGAVCVSLPDVPNAPQRVWPRLAPAAVITALVTLSVGFAHTHPVEMAALVALTAFCTLMMMAWGPRAGPLSFTGILALIFALPAHTAPQAQAIFIHAGWVLVGAAAYALWARLTAEVLASRFRQLALATALRASAQRLRSRAARMAQRDDDSIRASIADDQLLAEALQNARDQVFAARQSPAVQRQTSLLLSLIELRDSLLAIRLDMPLLGDDATGQDWRAAFAAAVTPMSATLDALAAAVAEGAPVAVVSAAAWRLALGSRLDAVAVAEDDPRRHLLSAVQVRFGHMFDDIAAMVERWRGPDRDSGWTRAELQRFVSPEGWPLAALKSHLNLQSSVMRHALRSALAFTTAYALGRVLPWGAHAYWLVLSVSVVLRGNLEQTLLRRNDRISGTIIGCLLVLVIAHLAPPWLLAVGFIAAVAVAHTYVYVHYRVAAAAASLMALLQPLLLFPGSHPAVAERVADTIIGALLAWAFCFVLPAWERGAQKRLTAQLRGVLARHATNVMQWAPTDALQVAQRLSRQQAYVQLTALAAAAQRSRVEPKSVRLPERQVEAVLDHAYRLMALLGAVQQMLSRRVDWLDPRRTEAELAEARKACVERLTSDITPAEPSADPDPEARYDADLAWPPHLGEQDLTPWIERRLQRCQREAARLTVAVGGLLLAIDSGA